MITFIIIFSCEQIIKQGIHFPAISVPENMTIPSLIWGRSVKVSHCTAHSRTFSIVLGASLTLGVTNVSLTLTQYFLKRQSAASGHFFLFSIMSTYFIFYTAGIFSGQFVIFPQFAYATFI